jgi:AcrR family transcriptional regulator
VTAVGRTNRGPSSAPANRRALVEAAREVFAEQGIGAPLSAVARRAGVGQGSLYRHFPDRMSLVIAAFEDNVAELEALAAQPDVRLAQVLDLITRQAVDSVAFVELAAGSRDDRLDSLSRRVEAALRKPLLRARREGTVRSTLRTADLMLAVTMVSGAIAVTPVEDRDARVAECWRLLRRGMRA